MNWLGRAWRGQISLAQAVWFIALPVFLLGCWITGGPAYLISESFFYNHPLLCFWALSGFKILLCSFVVVCVWRTANQASLEHDLDESPFAPMAARIGMVIFALVMILPSAAFLYLATSQYVKDPIGFSLRIKNS